MKIFISYSSSDIKIARPIYYELIGQGHSVFFDKRSIKEGEKFNEIIRKQVANSSLIIFLISPNSIKKDSYCLTELKFIENKWKHPAGHVLPVLIEDTNTEDIPSYLRSINIMKPKANISAEVSALVHSYKRNNKIEINKKNILIILIFLIIIFIIIFFINENTQKASSLFSGSTGSMSDKEEFHGYKGEGYDD